MGKFLIAKKTNQMKFWMKAAKEFSCSPVKQVLAIVEGQIDGNEVQNIYWDKDGQNIQGNILFNNVVDKASRMVYISTVSGQIGALIPVPKNFCLDF